MLQGCRTFTKLEFSLPVSFTKNYRSSRDDAKRTLENLLKITLKRVLPFSQIQFYKQAKWYFQTVTALTWPLTTHDSTHFVGLKFWFITWEEISSFVMLSSLGIFLSSFFSGIGILLRKLNGRRGGQAGVHFILGGKRHRYFLQVEFCNMHCGQKIFCSVVRACYSLLNGQGKSPIRFSRGWIHTF